MKLDEFNQKYRKGKKDNVYNACQEAVSIMRNSHDDLHDIKHIENILGIIDQFLTQKTDLKVDLDVLILATCWHDTWIALRKRKGIINLTYQRIAEGIASSLLFKRHANKYQLGPNLVKKVCYAIRKHSTVQITPRKTIEAKLLDDADKTDARNVRRIKNTYTEKRFLTRKLHLKITLFYLNRIDQKINYAEHYPIYYSYKRSFISYLEKKM
jgi:hypothetical protein